MINAHLSKIYGKKIILSLYTINLQALAIQMFKVHIKTSSEIMQDVFLVIKEQWNYDSRGQTDLIIPQVKNVNYGSESVQVLGPKIWEAFQMI